ncbi:MAG: TerD family protein [Propionibacteriaceae bacterium]|nr:TerD family protein [Propionibacteriaceae bacterium]
MSGESDWLLQLNLLTIRRRSAVFLPPAMGPVGGRDEILALIRDYGFEPSSDAERAIASEGDAWLVAQAAALTLGVPAAREPFYVNFPEQVKRASRVELVVNALMHYLGDSLGTRIMPRHAKKGRPRRADEGEKRPLGVIDDDGLRALTLALMQQGRPYSAQDRADLQLLKAFAPAEAPAVAQKENLAFLAAAFPHLNFTAQLATATDVLRYAVALSGGDVSLAEATRFPSFRRAQRREILALLDAVGREEDMRRWVERWKRLARHLRVSDYAARYPHAAQLLAAVCSGEMERTFNSRVEELLAVGDAAGALARLATRPGELARRLNQLLSLADGPQERERIVATFDEVGHEVATPVLIQLWEYFSSPGVDELRLRVVHLKGKQGNMLIPNRRVPRDVDARIVATVERAISARRRLGRVWLNRALFSRFTVPLGIRNAAPGARVAGRGTRLPLVVPTGGAVRLFMHWRDIDDHRVDLDLSGLLVSADQTRTRHVAYYNLREVGITHSGDITSAPDGASEYLDIEVERALAEGWRWVVMTVHSFTRQLLSAVPDALAGVMLRADVDAGEVFDPATVTTCFQLASERNSCAPLVFDLATREMIWWDSATHVRRGLVNLLESEDANIAQLKHLIQVPRMNLATLITLLADEVVERREDADVVFDDPAGAGRGEHVIGPWDAEVLGLLNPDG